MRDNIFFGEGGFINYGVKILDIAPVTIGDYVLLAPNVVLATVDHPVHLAERVKPYACAEPIAIGNSSRENKHRGTERTENTRKNGPFSLLGTRWISRTLQ